MDKMHRFIYSNPDGSSCVVQKYIERPLLFKGRKFDIRIYAICTTKNEVYFYKEGYLRMSSNQYDVKSSDLQTHLTNTGIQKHNPNYGKYEQGNILSF